jgi:uroporphyrinogen-III synthase
VSDHPLAGRAIGVTADRRWQEQAELFHRRGASVLHGPTMQTVDLVADEHLRALTAAFVEEPPDWMVATTGMGMRKWFEAAADWGLREGLLGALAGVRIVARGAKSSSAVRQAGLDVHWRAPGESMAEVVPYLLDQDLARAKVAIQLFDPDDHPATTALRGAVGELVELPLYRWLLPADRSPALRLVAAAVEGGLDAVTFTSQPAVRFLFAIAAEESLDGPLREALNGPVLPACIGPVCAEAAREMGIAEPVWPEPFRLPPMVRMVADRLGPRR